METRYRQLKDKKEVRKAFSLWNRLHRNFFIRPALIRQNIYSPFGGLNVEVWGAFRGEIISGVGVIKYENRGTDRRGWISLWGWKQEIPGGRFFSRLEERLATVGVKRVSFGGDYQNFFPGFPDGLPEGYRDELLAAGFSQGSKVYDLYRDIRGFNVSAKTLELRTFPKWKQEIRPLAKEEEEKFLVFLKENFPGRWQVEAENIRRIPGGIEDYWILVLDGKIQGFARVNRDDSPYLGANVNWINCRGENFCGLGPLGIAEKYREWGLGKLVIETIIEAMQKQGKQYMVIDWTDLLDFYSSLGFSPRIEYTPLSKEIPG